MSTLYSSLCAITIFLSTVIGNHYPGCKEPFRPGNCSKLDTPRFFYNVESKFCDIILSSKCPQSRNAFEFKEECESRCINEFKFNCSEMVKSGGCNEQTFHYRWYYNTANDTCEKFLFDGCNINMNKFLNREECEIQCRNPQKLGLNCTLPKVEGECQKMETKYYYDNDDGCMAFNYTGCAGNGNRFDDLESCHVNCEESGTEKIMRPEMCRLKMDVGNMNNVSKDMYVERYYYDSEEMDCKMFSYSGKGGKDNNFMTMEICLKMCPKSNRADHMDKNNENINNGLNPGGNHALQFLPQKLLLFLTFFVCIYLL